MHCTLNVSHKIEAIHSFRLSDHSSWTYLTWTLDQLPLPTSILCEPWISWLCSLDHLSSIGSLTWFSDLLTQFFGILSGINSPAWLLDQTLDSFAWLGAYQLVNSHLRKNGPISKSYLQTTGKNISFAFFPTWKLKKKKVTAIQF